MAQPLSLPDFMKAFCYKEPETKASDAVIHRGNSAYMDGYEVGWRIPKGCREIGEWQDGRHRFVWVNDLEHYTITYCEGDVIVVTCPDRESYDTEIGEASEFYSRH